MDSSLNPLPPLIFSNSINDWTLSLKNKRNVAIAYVDYSKAFDVVSHPKLLLKLIDWGNNWQSS